MLPVNFLGDLAGYMFAQERDIYQSNRKEYCFGDKILFSGKTRN